jgi:hypothetical protein
MLSIECVLKIDHVLAVFAFPVNVELKIGADKLLRLFPLTLEHY